MKGRTGVSVGACGNPDLITTSLGGSAQDPCPHGFFGTGWLCESADTRAWIGAADSLHDQVSGAWTLLQDTEAAHGTSAETFRLDAVMTSLEKGFKQLTKEPSIWERKNEKIVIEYISWMTSAACRLEEINRAIRKYKLQPIDSPTPGQTSGTVPPYVPPTPQGSKPVTQRVGETTLFVAGAALLIGGAYYFAKSRTGGGGLKLRSPLPPRT